MSVAYGWESGGRRLVFSEKFITIEKYYIEHEDDTKFDLTTARGVEMITECIYRKDSGRMR